MPRRPLRPVEPDERAAAAQDVAGAAANGTMRELLVAMRDRVARDVASDKTPPRDLAALTRRLLEIARELEALDARTDDEVTTHGTDGDGKWQAV